MFFGVEFVQDFYLLYECMCVVGLVYWIVNLDFYVVCGWDVVNEVIGCLEDFFLNLIVMMIYMVEGIVKLFEMDLFGGFIYVLVIVDDFVYVVYCKFVLCYLVVKWICVMEQFIVQVVDWLWVDGMQDGCIEWMGVMVNCLLMMVVVEFIGLFDFDIVQLVKWGYVVIQLFEGLVENDQFVVVGVVLMEFSGYIFEQFDCVVVDLWDNLFGEFVIVCVLGELDIFIVQVMMVILFVVGGEFMVVLLGSVVWILVICFDIQ